MTLTPSDIATAPTFAQLRSIWHDPQWLRTAGNALDSAPKKAFLVFDDQALHLTSSPVFEALTSPVLGNRVVICELSLDIFDLERRDKGRYSEQFQLPPGRELSRVKLRLSTNLRAMLSDPGTYGFHLQHVREYDFDAIRNYGIYKQKTDAFGLFVACASYFNRQPVKEEHNMEQTILVTDRPTLRKIAAELRIPWCGTADVLTYSVQNK